MRIQVIVFAIFLSASTLLHGEPRVRETHKDWTVVCDVPSQLQTEVCLIVQQRNLRDSEQPIIRVEIGYAIQTGAPFAVITTPLGVALAAGLSMRIDNGETTQFDYGSCIPKGCVVGAGLTDIQITSMKTGKEAQFTFKDNHSRDIVVPVSLKGFTAALRSIAPQ